MALLICSLLMGLQSVPGIIKPYSKGVVQFLTKVPEKQKSKDATSTAIGPGAYETAADSGFFVPRASGRPGAESFPFSSTNYDRTL